MTVLVTGATGMLGSTLSAVLAQAGHTVVRHGVTGAADVVCDFTQRDAVEQLLEAVQPEVVVNLIGKTNVDACESDMNSAYLLNVRTVENLVRAHSRRSGAYLVHISTDQVYDSAGPSREEDIRLTNVYSLTKYAGELAAARMPSAVLRTSFFGPSRTPRRQSFSDWVLEKLRAGVPFPVFSDIIVNPLSMVTLSEIVHRVLMARPVGTLNVGSRDALSKADFAVELARVYGLDGALLVRTPAKEAGLRAYRPTDMSMDCGRVVEAVGLSLPTLREEIGSLREIWHAAT